MDDWMRYLNGRRSHGPASLWPMGLVAGHDDCGTGVPFSET